MRVLLFALIGLFLSTSCAFAAVNINTADQQELATLSGIGDVKAQAIVSYRQEHGEFSNPSQLMQVNGIGQTTFSRLKDDVVISDQE